MTDANRTLTFAQFIATRRIVPDLRDTCPEDFERALFPNPMPGAVYGGEPHLFVMGPESGPYEMDHGHSSWHADTLDGIEPELYAFYIEEVADDPDGSLRATAPPNRYWGTLAQPKVVMVCSECGSDDVTIDGVFRWSVDSQRWEMSGLYEDDAHCGNCGCERDLVEEDHVPDTPESLLTAYQDFMTRNGLQLGSADEHLSDPALSQEQRDWLKDFVDRWDACQPKAG